MARTPEGDRQHEIGSMGGAGLAIADYGPAFRPWRALDLMHGAMTRFENPAIAFYPIVDAIILLLGKPLALIFHRQTERDSSPEPFFHTYPEIDLASLKSLYSDPALHSTLIAVPAAEGGLQHYSLSLANIREEISDTPGGASRSLRLEPYRASVELVDPHRPPTSLDGEVLDVWLLRRLFRELRATCERGSTLSRDVIMVLNEGLETRETPQEPACRSIALPWSDRDVSEWETVRDTMMENHWRDILDQSLPKARAHDGRASKAKFVEDLTFLCVFRFALPGTRRRFAKFDYGARIVLSRRQRAAVREWLTREPKFRSTNQGSDEDKSRLFRQTFGGDADEVIRALELPLGMDYRSISDTHFGSGFIDFAPEATYASESVRTGPERQVDDAGLAGDRRRKAAERLVLDEIGSRVFYVPIHVGGIPWLGLLILEDEVREKDASDVNWEESYHLYRGPVTTVGQQLRLSSQNAYSAALCAAVNQQLANSRADPVAAINREWRKLSAFFPFDAATLSPCEGRRNCIDFPAGKKVVLERASNPHGCFSRALQFDALRLPALQHDLKTVLETVVAKRLSALARQESAWAHDVKNWTNPILTELFALWQHRLGQGSESKGLYRALVHAKILNATAFARQTSGDRERQGRTGQDALDAYLAYVKRPKLERLLELILDLLLATHSENPVNSTEFELEWPNKRSVEQVLVDLALFIRDQTRVDVRDPTDVIGEPAVIWPLSLLREVIHNIEINDPLDEDVGGGRTITVDYRVERTPEAVVVYIRQTNFESCEWENGFAEGLRKANLLYGPGGAGVGWIDDDAVAKHEYVEVSNAAGEQVRVVQVTYELRVRFFLGGSSRGGSRSEAPSSRVHRRQTGSSARA